MTLLAPMTALFAGLASLPVLLAFYMLKLRRRPLTVSATFLWEQAVHDVQGNVPLRWIRPTLLFFLHALILALLVLALGRPAFESAGPTSARAFFLIDTSASMGATDGVGGQTRLDDAKSRAMALGRDLLNAPGRPVITLIAFAHDARVTSRPLDSVRDLRAALDEIEAMDQPGRLEPALRLTESLMSRPTDEGADAIEPVVAVFSDGAFADHAPLALSGARITLVPTRTETDASDGNLAVIACSAARSEGDPARALLFVRVQSTYRRPVPFTLTILVEGEPPRAHAMVVPAAADDGPGSVGQSFAVRVPGGALITAAIAADDLLESDNTASVYLASPVRPRVLLVHPDQSPADMNLRGVLEEVPLRSLRVMAASDYARFTAQDIGGAFEMVVFDRVGPAQFPPIPTISFGAWGGGIRTTEASGGGFILSWDRSAPVLAHVTLDSVQISRLGPIAAEGAFEGLGRAHELARVRGGPAMTRVDTTHGSRLFVGFALEDSNWSLQFSFPIFMLNAVDTLTGAAASRASVAFSTTEPVIAWAKGPGTEIGLDGPVPVTVPRPSDEPGLVSLGVFGRAGVYRGEALRPPVVAVNMLAAEESELAVSDSLVVGGTEAPRLEATVGRREIWHWFVSAAAALLVAEWFLYAARVRS